jgi:predicted  nucleic acid-binding Zn-ribbon protein
VKIKGDKGEDGAKGQSLESLTTQYYLSTSNEEVTGGEWTDKYPDTFDSTKYLWTRHKAVFVDPSSTAYDDPVLDATWMTTISAVNSASEAAQSAQAATTAAENAQKSADDALKKADALGDELEPIKEGIDQAKQDAADAKAAVGNETETILNQVAETYATKGDMTSIQGDLEAKISSSATTLESTISEKITQNNSDIVDDTISAITAQLSESQTELDKLVSQQSEAQQKLNEANDRLTEAEDTLAKLQADPSATQAQIDAAETAVSDAQTEVDNAQADVEAAMQAIKDVNSAIGQILSDSASLASRVTTAETNIKQNSDAIALTATKTEVSDALENYYTKTESDANFTISSDKISASVTEQLKNVKLGGANLIPKSAFESGVVESLDSTKSFEVSQSGVLLSAPWAYATLAKGQTYTLHFEALATKQTDIASETAQADEEAADETSVQDDTPTEGTIKLYLHESVNDTNFETWATGTISSDGTIVTFTENVTVPDTVNDADLKWNLNMDVPFAVSVQNLKLESGTLATDWTPAPEDTDADIKNALQTAIEQANTNIQVEAGSIKTTLSEQYQTKYVDVTYTDDDGKQQTEQRELLSYISSQISASADNVTFQFQTKTDDIDRDIAGLATTAKNVNTYFNFTENGLEIGKTGDTGKDIYLHIDNNDMSFMSRSGGTLATFTESALEVNEVNVGSTLTFGTDTKKFRFVPHTDGSLGFRKA